MARYYASKLWAGEEYFLQTDSHLMFAEHWCVAWPFQCCVALTFCCNPQRYTWQKWLVFLTVKKAQQLTHFLLFSLLFRDSKYILEVKAASSYPKAVLSSYPPGFPNQDTVPETPGARLCTCSTRLDDPNPIIRINTGVGYSGNALPPRPTQIPFIAGKFVDLYILFNGLQTAARLVSISQHTHGHSLSFLLFIAYYCSWLFLCTCGISC
jgi:hypothetical protein